MEKINGDRLYRLFIAVKKCKTVSKSTHLFSHSLYGLAVWHGLAGFSASRSH